MYIYIAYNTTLTSHLHWGILVVRLIIIIRSRYLETQIDSGILGCIKTHMLQDTLSSFHVSTQLTNK